MKRITLIIMIFVWIVAWSILPAAYAAVPHLLNYQGRVTDTSGAPLTGSYNITFRIYDAQTAGNLLWEETRTGVVVDKGLFGVLLGSVTALNLVFDKPYFLEIKVGTEVMSPRQQITSAGYALRSETAETLVAPGKVGTKSVDETNIGEGKLPVFRTSSGKLNYETVNSSSWVKVEKRVITVNSTSQTFSGLSPGVKYRVYLNLGTNPSGTIENLTIRFNNSSGTPYTRILFAVNGTERTSTSSANTYKAIYLSTADIKAGGFYLGEFCFQSPSASGTTVTGQVYGQGYYQSGGGGEGDTTYYRVYFGGEYRGTPLSSLQIEHVSGFTGEIILEKYVG